MIDGVLIRFRCLDGRWYALSQDVGALLAAREEKLRRELCL